VAAAQAVRQQPSSAEIRLRLISMAQRSPQRSSRAGPGSYLLGSLAEMDAAIEAIRKQIAGFEDIQASATTVVKGGEKIYKRAAVMSEEIERRLLLVRQEHASRLRSVGGED
jgi:DNA-binding NarL/FixJ family response regulator